ncbi:MAG: PLDc N-terminal domain-containing protein [Balneolales bacterium]
MDTFGWILLIAIVTIALWIYGIADILYGAGQGKQSKMLWLAIVILFPIIGVIFYFLVGKTYWKT